jgi:hypothetical protein
MQGPAQLRVLQPLPRRVGLRALAQAPARLTVLHHWQRPAGEPQRQQVEQAVPPLVLELELPQAVAQEPQGPREEPVRVQAVHPRG